MKRLGGSNDDDDDDDDSTVTYNTMMTRQLYIKHMVETPGDPWGVSNTTEKMEQMRTTSWTPMGQRTDKYPSIQSHLHS